MTCPKCHRPKGTARAEISSYQGDRCDEWWRPDPDCGRLAAAYAKGLAAGVELAKRTAQLGPIRTGGHPIDWTETDAELRRGGGG